MCINAHRATQTKRRHPFGYRLFCIVCFELFPRIELGTSSLPRKCSTTELKQHLLPKSGTKVVQVFELCNSFCKKNHAFLPSPHIKHTQSSIHQHIRHIEKASDIFPHTSAFCCLILHCTIPLIYHSSASTATPTVRGLVHSERYFHPLCSSFEP